MSVESLKLRKDIAWISPLVKAGEFGPPAYDEKHSSYRWRVFKRGFSWGKCLFHLYSLSRIPTSIERDGAVSVLLVHGAARTVRSFPLPHTALILWSPRGHSLWNV